MKPLDRWLQDRRFDKVRPYVQLGDRVLDIGTSDGAMFDFLKEVTDGVGIDPHLQSSTPREGITLVRGFFPVDLPDQRPFDVIALLAVLEHIPPQEQHELAEGCFRMLKPGGRLVLTVPSPLVDNVLAMLRLFRLIDGMSLEEHYGFNPKQTPQLFQSAGLKLTRWSRFQLGLNHLFVFAKPS